MKYFVDCEFIEGFHKPLFGKRRHHIDLISIGIACEDGRTYYAISNEFKIRDASDWVTENVLNPMFKEMAASERYCREYHPNLLTNKNLLKWQGKTNKQIAGEIMAFVNPDLGFPCSSYSNSELKKGGQLYEHFERHNVTNFNNYYYAQPEFYGYFADYDWVLICSLFGTMMQLPPGFPKYCRDLKQLFDETVIATAFTSEQLKAQTDYPKQINEHNALSDALWNFQLYKFLSTL